MKAEKQVRFLIWQFKQISGSIAEKLLARAPEQRRFMERKDEYPLAVYHKNPELRHMCGQACGAVGRRFASPYKL